MKKFVFCAFIAVILAACGQKPGVYESSAPEEKLEILQEYFMVPDAPVSNERPLPDVLSEQEVLLKAVDYAVAEGVLEPSFYAYEETPELMYAKVEVPILITNAATGVPDAYMLTAVDDKGSLLAEVIVNCATVTNGEKFEYERGFAISNLSSHRITKQETVDLIQSQFPGSTISEPMMIGNLRLEDNPYSNRGFFWYFTVDDNARSAADTGEEYIIEASIFGYRSIPGGVSNRAAINRGRTNLSGYRMAKLDTPIRLFNKLNAARAAGGASVAPPTEPREPVGFTPVELK
jgi:hypothetical protein